MCAEHLHEDPRHSLEACLVTMAREKCSTNGDVWDPVRVCEMGDAEIRTETGTGTGKRQVFFLSAEGPRVCDGP